jgi:hypothetical protein
MGSKNHLTLSGFVGRQFAEQLQSRCSNKKSAGPYVERRLLELIQINLKLCCQFFKLSPGKLNHFCITQRRTVLSNSRPELQEIPASVFFISLRNSLKFRKSIEIARLFNGIGIQPINARAILEQVIAPVLVWIPAGFPNQSVEQTGSMSMTMRMFVNPNRFDLIQ